MKNIFILTHENIILNNGLSEILFRITFYFLPIIWCQIRNLVCKLDQNSAYDHKIRMSCPCNIKMNNSIPRASLFYLGNQNFYIVR